MGSLSPADGKPRNKARKWRMYVSCGSDANGKRIQRSKRFSGTLKEAKLELARFEAECKGISSRDVTFEEFCDDFIARRKPLLSPTTYKTKLSIIKTLKQVIGPKKKLNEVTPYHIERQLNGMLIEGLQGKPCKPSYVYNLYSYLHTILDDAVRLEIIAKNPVDGVKRPSSKTAERVAPSLEVMQAAIDILDPKNRHEMCILLNMMLGLRRGEALGAKWSDINLKEKTIHIQRNLRLDKTFGPPKTDSGNRILPLPDALIEKLAIRYEALELEIKRNVAFGLIPEMLDMQDVTICAGELGEPISPATMTVWWKNHRAEFGMKDYTEHDLRHGYITGLAKAGVHPKTMQALAGHSSATLSLDIYSHSHMDDKRSGANAFADALRATKGKSKPSAKPEPKSEARTRPRSK